MMPVGKCLTRLSALHIYCCYIKHLTLDLKGTKRANDRPGPNKLDRCLNKPKQVALMITTLSQPKAFYIVRGFKQNSPVIVADKSCCIIRYARSLRMRGKLMCICFFAFFYSTESFLIFAQWLMVHQA